MRDSTLMYVVSISSSGNNSRIMLKCSSFTRQIGSTRSGGPMVCAAHAARCKRAGEDHAPDHAPQVPGLQEVLLRPHGNADGVLAPRSTALGPSDLPTGYPSQGAVVDRMAPRPPPPGSMEQQRPTAPGRSVRRTGRSRRDVRRRTGAEQTPLQAAQGRRRNGRQGRGRRHAGPHHQQDQGSRGAQPGAVGAPNLHPQPRQRQAPPSTPTTTRATRTPPGLRARTRQPQCRGAHSEARHTPIESVWSMLKRGHEGT